MKQQIKTTSIRDLADDELEAVSGAAPSVPPHIFDKLLAQIDKNLDMVKALPKGGHLPPG